MDLIDRQSDTISRQAAIEKVRQLNAVVSPISDDVLLVDKAEAITELMILPSAEPVIRCKDCKHNPKDEWFGCPMSHLSEAQRPETAWCWKGERRTDAETEV